MVKPELTLFEVQDKGSFMNTTESTQPGFCIPPEAFDSINMSFTTDEFILPMMNSKMLFIADVNQAIISSPTIRVDNTFKVYTTSDDSL